MAGSQIQSLLDPATFDLLDAYDRFSAMLVRDLASDTARPARRRASTR